MLVFGFDGFALLCYACGVCLLDFACGFTSVAGTLVVCGCLLVGQLFVCLFWVCGVWFVCVCLGFVNWVIVWFTSCGWVVLNAV